MLNHIRDYIIQLRSKYEDDNEIYTDLGHLLEDIQILINKLKWRKE
jgi:hypothetical protein